MSAYQFFAIHVSLQHEIDQLNEYRISCPKYADQLLIQGENLVELAGRGDLENIMKIVDFAREVVIRNNSNSINNTDHLRASLDTGTLSKCSKLLVLNSVLKWFVPSKYFASLIFFYFKKRFHLCC